MYKVMVDRCYVMSKESCCKYQSFFPWKAAALAVVIYSSTVKVWPGTPVISVEEEVSVLDSVFTTVVDESAVTAAAVLIHAGGALWSDTNKRQDNEAIDPCPLWVFRQNVQLRGI